MSQYDKDECKILISEYLSSNTKTSNERIKVKNASQLFYIIDFLIEYISSKEKVFKDKMNDTMQENKELSEINSEHEATIKKLQELIENSPILKEKLTRSGLFKISGQNKNVNFGKQEN